MKKTIFLPALLGICLAATAQPDLKPVKVFPVDYLPVGTHKFDVMVQNSGTTFVPWGGFKICWKVDNGPVNEVLPVTPTFAVAAGSQQVRSQGNFMAAFPTAGNHTLKVWTKLVSQTDANTANDTITHLVKVREQMPLKNVLFEVFKHQACCPCFPAAIYEDTVVSLKANYAIANIYTYNGDVIYNSDGEVINDQYGLAHPSVLYDRYRFPYANSLERNWYTMGSDYILEDINERDRYYEPVEVKFNTFSYNSSTRLLKVKLRATFFDTVSGDLRFNLYLTEDSVKAWQGCAVPDPYDYYHHHVLRYMAGGPWGQSGSIPASVSAGQTVSYEFTYTLPAAWKTDQINLIGLVQRYETDDQKRRVYNSTQMRFTEGATLAIAGPDDITEGIKLYPNPAAGKLFVETGGGNGRIAFSIIGLNGRVLHHEEAAGSRTELDIRQLPAGVYLLRATAEHGVKTIRFTKE